MDSCRGVVDWEFLAVQSSVLVGVGVGVDVGAALASGDVMASLVVLGVLDRNLVDVAYPLGSLDFGAGLDCHLVAGWSGEAR
jgi:hypothetical protein